MQTREGRKAEMSSHRGNSKLILQDRMLASSGEWVCRQQGQGKQFRGRKASSARTTEASGL